MNEGDVYVFKSVDSNSTGGPKFIGYFVLEGKLLGIRFEEDTEEEVRRKAIAMFEETRDKREQTRANIEEGRRKAAETRAKKIIKSQMPEIS